MLLQNIYTTAQEQPSKLAVIYNGREFNYVGFAGAIGSTISFLEEEDLPAGHTVVVIIYTLVDCWVTVLALQALGLNTVCVHSYSMIDALGLEPVGVVTTAFEYSKHQLESNTGTGRRIIVIPDPMYNSSVWPKVADLKDKKIIGGHILYTSGTTGTYKKILLEGSLQEQRNTERIASSTFYDANTKYHCNAFGLWTAAGYRNPPATWQAGGCVIFELRPEWYRYFLQSGMTHAILIPDMVHQLLQFLDEQPSTVPMDFQLLVSAGFISRNLAEKITSRVTKNLENLYGSTEMYRPVLRSKVSNLDDLHWLETPEFRRIEIVDVSGNICPIDVEGQLRVLLEETDCHSYLDHPQASEKVFREGYFYPGDMAVRRADGRIRVLGRSDDVINLRGQKIAVAPMEHTIQERLGVDAVCVFSSINGAGAVEVVIVIQADHWPGQSELNDLGRDFSQFDQVRFALVQRFPRTQTGTSKINRIALRKMVIPTAE